MKEKAKKAEENFAQSLQEEIETKKEVIAELESLKRKTKEKEVENEGTIKRMKDENRNLKD